MKKKPLKTENSPFFDCLFPKQTIIFVFHSQRQHFLKSNFIPKTFQKIMFILKLPWGQWSKTYCAMSPAESEGLNKKSLVLPETKISLKLIRSSGIVKRGILEAVVLAPVDVQAALFLGLKVFWGQEQIWPREAQKILQLILIYIKGILDEASRQRGPRLSRSCRLRRPPSFFSCSQITTHSFSREKKN